MPIGVLSVSSSNPFLKLLQIHLPTANRNSSRLSTDDDDNPLWERFSVTPLPTVVAFEKGKIISRRDAKMGIGLVKSDLDYILKGTNTVP